MTFRALQSLIFFCPLSVGLKISPLPSPTYLGTTIRISWTSEAQDPPFFNLYTQCRNLPPTPKINATTANGKLFINLPAGFNFGVSLPCYFEARVAGTNEVLCQSSNFTLIFQDSPSLTTSLKSTTTATTRSTTAENPSITSPPDSLSTVSLISILIDTEDRSPVTVSLSTVTRRSGSTSTSLSSADSSNTLITTSSPDPSINKSPPIAAIAGASVGGVLFVSASCIFIIIWRRRRRPALPLLEPLIYDSGRSSMAMVNGGTASNSSEQNVDSEAPNDNPLEETAPVSQAGGTEEQLRQMVQQMSERILALEEAQVTRNTDNEAESEAPAPPGYSDVGHHPNDHR